MDATSSNRRISLALVALIASAIALHVHAIKVQGQRPAPQEAKGRALQRPGKKSHSERDAKSGTQSKRILRHIQAP